MGLSPSKVHFNPERLVSRAHNVDLIPDSDIVLHQLQIYLKLPGLEISYVPSLQMQTNPMAARLGVAINLVFLLCLRFSVSCDAAVQFDYTNGPNGPTHWGTLKPEWFACKNGTRQSPISVTEGIISVEKNPESLHVVYKSGPLAATISHNGHTPVVTPPVESGKIKIAKVEYELRDFHFHIPSEHKILGQSFAMEMHLVHQSADLQSYAVIAVFFDLGFTKNKFLGQFFGDLVSYTPPGLTKNATLELPEVEGSFARYKGSLTTPPCSETVTWTLLADFETLSYEQFDQLRDVLPEENARPVRLINGRKVSVSAFTLSD